MQRRNKPYCRLAARGTYSNTENKDLHRWSDLRDRFAVHASEVIPLSDDLSHPGACSNQGRLRWRCCRHRATCRCSAASSSSPTCCHTLHRRRRPSAARHSTTCSSTFLLCSCSTTSYPTPCFLIPAAALSLVVVCVTEYSTSAAVSRWVMSNRVFIFIF